MRPLSLVFPLALLGGCIIYDTHGKKCHGCDDDGWWDTGASGDPSGDDPAGETRAFTLTPSTAEVGETFIASLTAAAAFDFATVEGVEMYGDVEVLATEARAGELLLTLSVSATAVPGASDLLLLLPADRVEFVPNALTIVPAGADGGDDSGDDDGSGTGCAGDDGTGDDGTGDDGTGDSGICP